MELFRPNDSFTRDCRLQMKANADSARFLIDGVVGNTIATVSIVFNLLLFYVFSTSERLRRQNYANPVLLAGFDVLSSICYMVLLPAQVIFYHYRIGTMIAYWFAYVRFVHCAQLPDNLNLLLSLRNPSSFQKMILVFLVRRKVGKIITIVLLAILLKGTMLLETEIEYLPHCDELERFVPVVADELDDFAAVRYWGRKISTVIVPFFILIYCNCRIVMQLRHRQKETQKQSLRKRSTRGSVTNSSIRQHYREKRGVRTATKTLVLVVGCYLLSNVVSVLLGLWEHVAPDGVESNYYRYLVVSDIASLLTIVGCLMRLPIYCVSDARIRKAVGRALLRCRVRTIPTKVRQNQLDKWSIVVVSNSLRSNLTGMNNLYASQNGDHSTNELWLTDIMEEESDPERKSSRFQSVLAEV
ncbi:unnamed protein product [Nippostrongylus brasiliensis]|uniref:G_PROTEIN_RECEP_F1_2 domain-containing protein n=2 Tax=Nippostrongylus brasiliensis TaxID=27835 RepID=A0A0N4XCW4_NIPBR|nr:unnamed protein product [Nippostrongylus brasiliensis]